MVIFTQAENILMIPGTPRSHQTNFATIGMELVQRGHKVSVFIGEHNTIVDGFQKGNMTLIAYECEDPNASEDLKILNNELVKMILDSSGNLRDFWNKLAVMIDSECNRALGNEAQIKALENMKFDLLFMDSFFAMKCMYLIPHRLGVPYVSLADGAHPWTVGFIWPPSFVPNVLTQFTERMNFWERLQNFCILLGIYYFPLVPSTPAPLAERYRILYGDYGTEEDIISKSMMWILTSDYLLNYPTPNFPNMIETPGLTTKPASPLPDDLKTFMDSSTNGVVIVSFGSLAEGLPQHIAQKMVDAFKQLRENVIWKFRNEHNLDLPSNIKIMDWLPQNDLLGHQNTKVFVTHCGNNGQHEALYHGVPMVGLAIVGDQPYNCRRIEMKGYGICMMVTDFTTIQLENSINTVVNNKTYKDKIKKASNIYLGRKETPAQIGANAIEHAIKYGGEYMMPYSRFMPLYQIAMLDVALFILLSIFSIIFIIKKLVCCLILCCRTGKKVKKE